MAIYLGLAIFELILAYQYERIADKKRRKHIWFWACFLMWAVLGLRSIYTGSDTLSYINGFHLLQNTAWGDISTSVTKDVGYSYLAKALNVVSDSEVWFMMATAFLSCFGVWDYIKRSATNPVFALFFFITLANFLFLLTGIRQSIAISLCLFSLRYVEKKKIVPFGILIFLAFTCHKSALLFAPIYFISRLKIGKKSIFFSVILTLVAVFGYETLLDYVHELLGYETYGVESVSNGIINYAIFLGIVIVGYIYRGHWIESKRHTISMNTGIIAVMIWTFRLFSRTAERPSMFFQPALPVVLSNALVGIKNIKNIKNGRVLRIMFILAALILFTKRALETGYQFFWQ